MPARSQTNSNDPAPTAPCSVPEFAIAVTDVNMVCAKRIRTATSALVEEFGSLILDIGQARYIDSVILALLSELDEACTARGGILVAAGVHPGVIRQFEMIGLEIRLAPDVETAREILKVAL